MTSPNSHNTYYVMHKRRCEAPPTHVYHIKKSCQAPQFIIVEAYKVEQFWWWTSDDGQAFMITQPHLKLVEVFGYVLCKFRTLWKALNTYTKYPSKSTWPSNIVDYPIYSRLANNPSRLDLSKTITQVSVCSLSWKLVDLTTIYSRLTDT